MKSSEPRTEFGVFVKIDGESYDNVTTPRHTAWIEAYPIVLNYKWASRDESTWRYCGSLDGEQYEHLSLTALLATDCTSQTVGGGSVRAKDIYSIEEYHVKMLLKSMSAINRKLEKMYHDEGNALSFGQLVLRFAKTISAKQVVVEYSKDAQRNCGERWHYLQTGEAVSYVDRMIFEWRKAKNPEYVAPTF